MAGEKEYLENAGAATAESSAFIGQRWGKTEIRKAEMEEGSHRLAVIGWQKLENGNMNALWAMAEFSHLKRHGQQQANATGTSRFDHGGMLRHGSAGTTCFPSGNSLI